jgi:hypothetical protein
VYIATRLLNGFAFLFCTGEQEHYGQDLASNVNVNISPIIRPNPITESCPMER